MRRRAPLLATATVTAILLALLVVLLGVLLTYGRRWLGTQPLMFMVMLLALATPLATTPIWPNTGRAHLTWGLAVLLPGLVALYPLYRILMGPKAARTPAVFPLLGTIGFSSLAMVSGMVSGAPGPDLGGGSALGLVALGVVLTGALLAAGVLVEILPRWTPGGIFVPLFSSIPMGAVVLVVVSGHALSRLGFPVPGSPTSVPLLAPLAATFLCSLLAGAYAWHETSRLAPGVRRELMSDGSSRPLLDEYRAVDRQFRSSLEAGYEAAETYRRLADHHDTGTYIATPEGRIEYANAALSNLLDQPGERLTGVNICYLFGGGEEGRARFERYPLEPGTHRRWITLPSGARRPVELRVEQTEEGLIQGWVCDLTEELLRKRIETHKEEIERQKERAEFYVDLLRHDIGNYVTGPLTFLETLLRRDDLDEDVRLRLDMASTNLEEIAGLLERIDVLSQLEDLQPTPVDAGELVARVGARFDRKHQALQVEIQLPEAPVWVQGSSLLEEVLVNLLGNARKHAGDQARVFVGAEPGEGGTWILHVSDNGPGIADEDKQAVFERFVHDQRASGKGLGLYIVRTIVEALGGRVWVEDRVPGDPSQGASFRVELARAEQERRSGLEESGGDKGPATAAA